VTQLRPLGAGVCVVGQFVDALELSWEPIQTGRWGDDPPDNLERTLAVLRRSAQQSRARWVPSGWTTTMGEAVKAAGRGVRQSAYQLECSDWLAGIATDGAPGPRGFFQLRAVHLADRGALAAYEQLRDWVDADLRPLVGREVEHADDVWRISRIDLAVDVAGVSLRGADLDAFTTRATSRRAYDEPAVSDYAHRQFTGFRFGRRGGPIFARIYKKTAEAADDAWVRDVWREAGYDPSVHGGEVWRVEFELRGALLRELMVDGQWLPRDPAAILGHHLTNLWAYATRRWLVLHERQRTRVERDRVSAWWDALAHLDGFEAEPVRGEKFRRLSPPARNPRHLASMAVGVLTSLAALHGQETWEDARDGLDEYVKHGMGERAFALDVRRKAKAHEWCDPLPGQWLDVLLGDGTLPEDWLALLPDADPELEALPEGVEAWRSAP